TLPVGPGSSVAPPGQGFVLAAAGPGGGTPGYAPPAPPGRTAAVIRGALSTTCHDCSGFSASLPQPLNSVGPPTVSINAMNQRVLIALALTSGLVGTAAAASLRRVGPPVPQRVRVTPAKRGAKAAAGKQAPGAMTLPQARVTVRMLDDAYQTVLQEVHRTYATQPGRPVAATVVRDVQKRMGEKQWPQSRFLAVNA